RPRGGELAQSDPNEEAPPSPMLPPDAGDPMQAEDMPQTVRSRAEEMRMEAERRQQEMIARIGPDAAQSSDTQEPQPSQPEPADGQGQSDPQQSGEPGQLADAATEEPQPDSAQQPAAAEQYMEEYYCLSCGHEWESAQELGLGDKCPNCGTTFADMEYEEERSSRGSYRKWKWIIRLSIFAVITILGAVGKMMSKG
ncbi:MAG: hypothetical protein KDA37_15215, partial [Planctomycetales bacterium]|nr:hypothetical protein [Planctomycetales bacterium]